MMPPVARHAPVHHVRHLHAAVAAAGAVSDSISHHAAREAERRQAEAERRQAEAKLRQSTAVSRETL